MHPRGIAYLIGTGPGDLGLVTLRAKALIEQCEVILYDYLCNPEVLRWAKPETEIVYVGKQGGNHALTQEQINALIVDRTASGKHVARLKGGDPFVFGRGGEEAQELVRAGLRFEVVPGVTSAVAAPAYAGIPVTHRDYTSSLTLLTGHEDPTKATSSLDWAGLGAQTGTRVILMGVERLRAMTRLLIEHGSASTLPCALIRWGTYPRQRTLVGTLGTIADLAEAAAFKAPAIFILGEVVGLRQELNWFESRPLFGQRIVVTRTRAQASALSQHLQTLGADVLEIPTIRIMPLDWTARYPVDSISRDFDWLIFTSPNAVELFFTGFIRHWGDIRLLGSLKIAAVGPATAGKIRGMHLPVDKQPSTFTTAALAAAFSPEELQGQRFCLARGNLADPGFTRHFLEHGATVSEWTIYETLPETEDRTGTRERFTREGADWITFTSASTVENWLALGLQPPAHQTSPPRHASIGPVTSAALRQHGASLDLEAALHTIDGLVNALLTYTPLL